MIDHFRMMARYNAWANGRLYAACAAAGAHVWASDAGLFFGSLRATLNHLLVADRIWMRRLTGEGPTHGSLNEVAYAAFHELRTEREALDARLIAYVDALDDAMLADRFTYTPVTNPEPVTQARAPVLAHVFNHQTHHRGQCHAALTRLSDEAPEMDLIYYQRAVRLGQA